LTFHTFVANFFPSKNKKRFEKKNPKKYFDVKNRVSGKTVEKNKRQNIFAETNLEKKIFWKYFLPCFHESEQSKRLSFAESNIL
jgi:hypothetical protein